MAGLPAADALQRFTFVRVGCSPMTPPNLPSRARTGLGLAPPPNPRAWCSRSKLLSLRCRVPCIPGPGLVSHLPFCRACQAHHFRFRRTEIKNISFE